MGIVLDVIIFMFIAGLIYIGYKKGLVKVGINLIAFVISLLLTTILYTPITNVIINNTEIDEKIEEIVIANGISKEAETSESSNISEFLQNYTHNIITDAENAVVENTARSIAVSVVGIGVMISLFIIIRLLCILLSFVADIFASLPIVKQFNEIGGILYGLLKSLVIIYVILAVLFLIMTVNANETIASIIEASYVTKFFYDNNIILLLLF